MLDYKDGGAKSRKLWYAMFTSFSIFAGALVASKSDAFAAVYDTMVGGLLGALGIYLSGNVGTKWVINKQATMLSEQQQPPGPPVER